MYRSAPFLLVLAAAVVLVSCSDSGTEPCVLSVTVSPATTQIELNETDTLTADVTTSGPCGSVTVTWASDDPAVVSVSSTGQITGLVATSTTIRATATDATSGASASGSAVVFVVPVAVPDGS